MRFNPKHIWTGVPDVKEGDRTKPTFEVAELREITDPMIFIEKTKDQYPGLDIEEVREAFEEVKAEMIHLAEEEKAAKAKTKKKSAAKSDENVDSTSNGTEE